MKLIQVLAIAAALAVSAAAQNTNSANSTAQPKTTDAQKKDAQKKDSKTAPGTPIKVTTPKDAKTGAPASASSHTASTGKTAASQTPQTKTGTQKTQPIVVNAQPKTGGAPAKSTPAGKTPVVAVAPQSKPKQNTSASKGGPFMAKPATAQKKPAVVAVAPKSAPKKSAVAKKQEPKVTQKTASATPVQTKPAARKISATGRRDPFVSPIRNVAVGQVGPSCSTGKKCLYIPELIVQGTVKDNTTGEMMAVVVNRSRHTYFLRENDQVFNGLVEKITGDSVVFREFATDNVGREAAHEVVKRVSSAS